MFMQKIAGNPVLIAHYGALDVYFEGESWSLPRTDRMLAPRAETRYADICSEAIQEIADIGWQFTHEPLCFTAATKAGRVVAIGWAAPIRTEEGEIGCNLSYAVEARYEGRGLATLLSAIAFLACAERHPSIRFANIECRADNGRSVGVAQALGLRRYRQGDFSMTEAASGTDIPYLCFRKSTESCRRQAARLLQERMAGD